MPTISFRGTREGLSITLGDGEWDELVRELAVQLDRPGAQTFFRGARVLLETGSRALGITELEELIELLKQRDMTLTSVTGEEETREAFERLHPELSDTASAPIPEEGAPVLDAEGFPEEDLLAPEEPYTLLIRRTLRSGQTIQHPGTVVVFGDVNPGAEIVADGDIFVWGKLRGDVHAGAAGDETSVVGALVLTPGQLRISYRRAPSMVGDRGENTLAEIARVQEGQIIFEPWSA